MEKSLPLVLPIVQTALLVRHLIRITRPVATVLLVHIPVQAENVTIVQLAHIQVLALPLAQPVLLVRLQLQPALQPVQNVLRPPHLILCTLHAFPSVPLAIRRVAIPAFRNSDL